MTGAWEKFEEKVIEEADLSLSHRQAYQEALRVLERKSVLETDHFAGIYKEEDIDSDRQYVIEREKDFSVEGDFSDEYHKQRQRLAAILEAVFYEETELNDWLGPRAYTFKTSRYDDIKNGVDTVVEFLEDRKEPSHLALAIDVTTGQDLGQKFERIRNEIELGNLATIKYFKSENTGFRGKLENVPRVVLGADPETVGQLGELWLEKKNNTLAKHSIQFQILEEILLQLRAFGEYADRCGKTGLAAVYRERSETVEKIRDEKLSSLEDPGKRDSVFEAIQSQVNRLLSQR